MHPSIFVHRRSPKEARVEAASSIPRRIMRSHSEVLLVGHERGAAPSSPVPAPSPCRPVSSQSRAARGIQAAWRKRASQRVSEASARLATWRCAASATTSACASCGATTATGAASGARSARPTAGARCAASRGPSCRTRPSQRSSRPAARASAAAPAACNAPRSTWRPTARGAPSTASSARGPRASSAFPRRPWRTTWRCTRTCRGCSACRTGATTSPWLCSRARRPNPSSSAWRTPPSSSTRGPGASCPRRWRTRPRPSPFAPTTPPAFQRPSGRRCGNTRSWAATRPTAGSRSTASASCRP